MSQKKKTIDDLKGKIDFGIITIRDDEYQAVQVRLASPTIVQGRQIYAISSLKTNDGQDYSIALVKSPEQGNTAAQTVAHNLIEDLNPQCLVVCGIAGT